MDIRMPVPNGLEATRQIVGDPDLGGVRVIILTTFEPDEYVFEAIRSGASGFLVKDTEPEDLVSAIRVVAARRRPAVAERHPQPDLQHRRARSRRSPLTPPMLSVLTDREREVLARVGRGPEQRRDRSGACS